MKPLVPAAALLLFGFLITVLAYLPAMRAGFYFDDLPNVVHAPALHWDELSLEQLRSAAKDANIPTRWVANVTFGLDHLRAGLNPAVYHQTNLLIHLAVGAALAWVAGLLALAGRSSRDTGSTAPVAAALSAVVFLVHPLGIQAVTYVVQRMTSLSTLFGLVAFALYLTGRSVASRPRRALSLSLAAISWILASVSKENALVLPALAALYEICFRRGYWRDRLRDLGQHRRRRWLLGAAAGLLLLVVAWSAVHLRGATVISLFETFPGRDFNGWERVLSQARVQVFYATLLIWPAPSRLNLDHDFPVARSLAEPSTLAASAFWLAVLVGGLLLARRRPRLGFPLLAYLLLHAVESGPLDLELAFEHRMYFPMTALAWLLAVVVVDLGGWRRGALLSLAAIVVLPLAVATHRRNVTWSDPVAFHYDCARKAPDKYRPQYNLGTVLGVRGRHREAISALKKAVALRPGSSQAHNQLGAAYASIDALDEALVEYRAAVRLGPWNAQAHYNLATLLDSRGRPVEAVELYRRFLRIAPPELAVYRRRVEQRLALLPRPAPPVR